MTGIKFSYTDTSLDDETRKVATFRFELETDRETFTFSEKITFPEALSNNPEITKLLEILHIALGISYYKSFIPPSISHPYEMSDLDAEFWNSIYRNGLGEFLYKNQLDSSLLAKFSAQSGQQTIAPNNSIEWKDRALLGIGGGKDSVVAGELLKEIGIPLTGFVLATGDNTGQSSAVAQVMGVDLQIVNRQLDMSILEVNKLEGAYNGHVPISLIFAICGCILATNKGDKFVVVANEASASIPHANWQGTSVNHQWSKSLEFEKLFQEFIKRNISPELTYFSAVRPLSSVGVAKLFSRYPEYFEVFTSDNGVFKIDPANRPNGRWGVDSAKSLSSFILLAPWLEDDELLRIFGVNLLEYSTLSELLVNLLGAGERPVLDCVGTPAELQESLTLLHNQNRFIETELMQLAIDKQLLVKESSDRFLYLSNDHALPKELKNKILTAMEARIL